MKKRKNNQLRITILLSINIIAFVLTAVFSYVKSSENRANLNLLEKKVVDQNKILKEENRFTNATTMELQKIARDAAELRSVAYTSMQELENFLFILCILTITGCAVTWFLPINRQTK